MAFQGWAAGNVWGDLGSGGFEEAVAASSEKAETGLVDDLEQEVAALVVAGIDLGQEVDPRDASVDVLV